MSYVTEGQPAGGSVERSLHQRAFPAFDDRPAPRPEVPAAVVVSPVPLIREGMARALEQIFGRVVVHSATDLEGATRLAQRFGDGLFWVHEKAYPHLGFVQVFARRRSTRGIVVMLDPGGDRPIPARVSEAVRAGATVVLDSASPADVLTAGLRRAVHGQNYLSPRLRPGFSSATAMPSASPRVSPLTVRESQLLRLMAEGLDNRTIGETLNISVETVRTHVKSILKKLVARNRCDAVGRAFRLGIVEPDALPPVRFSA
ncbi:helix-turn-helix domain-containing protein [Amycolatopsis magusensis]|uniref:helix-turn-helix domain-containing protein n=1 Tax=Amycolatopsis magusensis TaxID=882444 RepID=UPI003C2E0D21